ncbi:hypothetical protein MASR2M79_18860 [Aminivibrio sp.]
MKKAEKASDEKGGDDAEPGASGTVGDGEAGIGPKQHDPLEAEFVHLFSENFTEGGVENGRAAPHGGGEDGMIISMAAIPP